MAFLILGVLVLVNIFLRVRHVTVFVKASDFWYEILFKGYNYSNVLKLIPFVSGLGMAIAQYFPETVNKRIKLTFHLPVKENKVLLGMHGYGFVCLVLLFAIFIVAFIAGSYIYFPHEIINSALVTDIPWFLGGFVTYFMTALILLEPVWLYRVLYTLVAYSFISLFYISIGQRGYSPAIISLTVLTLLSSIVVLFSGYRFRKGEM